MAWGVNQDYLKTTAEYFTQLPLASRGFARDNDRRHLCCYHSQGVVTRCEQKTSRTLWRNIRHPRTRRE